MYQTEEVEGVPLNLVIDVEWKRLGAAAGKTMGAKMVTATPPYDLASLPGNAFAERAGQSFGDLAIFALFARQVIAKLPAEN